MCLKSELIWTQNKGFYSLVVKQLVVNFVSVELDVLKNKVLFDITPGQPNKKNKK